MAKLQKSLSPGDLDPGNIYTESRIVGITFNPVQYIIQLEYEIGNTTASGTVWTKGAATSTRSIIVTGNDYNYVMTGSLISSENFSTAMYRLCYQYLNSKNILQITGSITGSGQSGAHGQQGQ